MEKWVGRQHPPLGGRGGGGVGVAPHGPKKKLFFRRFPSLLKSLVSRRSLGPRLAHPLRWFPRSLLRFDPSPLRGNI